MNNVQHDNSLFAELYDVHPQAIVWSRPVFGEGGTTITDFEYTYCNDEGLRYLNLTREQLAAGIRLSSSPTVTTALRTQFLEEMVRVYQTGEKSEASIYNPALNKYARVLRTKLRGGVLSIVQDRTEENCIIQRLEDQKRLLDNILKNSSNGISVSQVFRDESGTVIDAQTILANDAAVRYIGFPKEIYLTKRATEIEPAVMHSPYYRACIQTLQTGEPFVMQYQMQSTGKWLELTVSKLDNDHLIQIFTDVTLIKEAQLRLEQAAERLQAVFNASQSGMFTLSPVTDEGGEVTDFRFVITNPRFAAYVGQTPPLLEDRLASIFFPGYLSNGVFAMYKETYLTGKTNRQEVHYNVDEHDLYLDLLSTKVDDEVLVTFTDYTAIKKTQVQLEKLVEDLRKSNAMLEEFAHAASHDLKEPIRKIGVFTERLKSTLGDRMNETEQRMFERMQSAAQRMTSLVEDLLTYSEVSTTPHQMETVDLNVRLRTILSDLEVAIEEKKATLQIAPLPVVKGFKRQLQQLFQNLVSNALKCSHPGTPPRISISAALVSGSNVPLPLPLEEAGKSFHLIEVADNGIGFDQQHAEKIFQMFQRLHGKSEYAGTGIGLSIARKVAHNHGGYIWAESEPGKGSLFKVLLPA